MGNALLVCAEEYVPKCPLCIDVDGSVGHERHADGDLLSRHLVASTKSAFDAEYQHLPLEHFEQLPLEHLIAQQPANAAAAGTCLYSFACEEVTTHLPEHVPGCYHALAGAMKPAHGASPSVRAVASPLPPVMIQPPELAAARGAAAPPAAASGDAATEQLQLQPQPPTMVPGDSKTAAPLAAAAATNEACTLAGNAGPARSAAGHTGTTAVPADDTPAVGQAATPRGAGGSRHASPRSAVPAAGESASSSRASSWSLAWENAPGKTGGPDAGPATGVTAEVEGTGTCAHGAAPVRRPGQRASGPSSWCRHAVPVQDADHFAGFQEVGTLEATAPPQLQSL